MKYWKPSLLVTATLLVTMSTGVQAARQLLKHPHHPVTWTTERCDRESEVTVSTLRPWDLESNSAILVALLRSAAVAISYECPELEQLHFQVRDLETDQNLRRGQVSRHLNWQLSAQSSQYDQAPSFDSGAAESVYRVAGVELGMSLDEARAIMRDQFGDEPGYRPRARMLVSRHGRCRPAYSGNRRPGADDNRCMRVWMSDHTVPQVERIMLVHELPHRLGVDIDDALRQRFGRPVAVTPIYESGFDARRLVWGRPLSRQDGHYPAGEGDDYELEAEVFETESSTRIVLRLGGNSQKVATMSHDDFNVLDWRTPKL